MTEGDPFKEELKGIRRERGKVTLAHRMLFGTDCDGAAPKDQSAVGLAVACMVNARLRAGTGSGSNLSRGTTTCGACPSCRLALGMARIQYSSSEQLQKDQVHHDQYFPSPISMKCSYMAPETGKTETHSRYLRKDESEDWLPSWRRRVQQRCDDDDACSFCRGSRSGSRGRWSRPGPESRDRFSVSCSRRSIRHSISPNTGFVSDEKAYREHVHLADRVLDTIRLLRHLGRDPRRPSRRVIPSEVLRRLRDRS